MPTSRRRDGSAAGARAPQRLGLPKRARIVLVAALALGALFAGAWLWLRDSSLVTVEHVTVTGATGPDAAEIRSALVRAAHDESTLDVRMTQLRNAVAAYPVVKDLQVTTQFPHGMRIRVVEQVPVGVVVAAGHSVAVAADGTLIRDLPPTGSLPVIPVGVPPVGRRVTDADARAAVAVLAAAPPGLLARVGQVATIAPHGVVAQIGGGPSIYFGPATQLRAKWQAAVAVLADPGSVGAVYIDVIDPERPAAGAGSAPQSGTAAQSASTAGTSAGTAGTSAGAAGTSAGAADAVGPGGTSVATGGAAGTAPAATQGAQQGMPQG